VNLLWKGGECTCLFEMEKCLEYILRLSEKGGEVLVVVEEDALSHNAETLKW